MVPENLCKLHFSTVTERNTRIVFHEMKIEPFHDKNCSKPIDVISSYRSATQSDKHLYYSELRWCCTSSLYQPEVQGLKLSIPDQAGLSYYTQMET